MTVRRSPAQPRQTRHAAGVEDRQLPLHGLADEPGSSAAEPARLTAWPPPAAAAGLWRDEVASFLDSAPGQRLGSFIQARLAEGATIFPPNPFRALELTPPETVRVVILGQDPYHGAGQAHGLAFSVPDGVAKPPSLRNIFQELHRDLGIPLPPSGSLEAWARQGVLLLNTCFTVEQNRPASHAGQGWEGLTGQLVRAIQRRNRPTVYLLWGAHAQTWRHAVESAATGDLVLCCNHPSPLSARRPPAPFIGCGHFGQAGRFLLQHGAGTVSW